MGAVQQAVQAQVAAADRYAAQRQADQGGRSPWACERCTFRHEGPDVMATECVMCGGPPPILQPTPELDSLPAPSAPPLQEAVLPSTKPAPAPPAVASVAPSS